MQAITRPLLRPLCLAVALACAATATAHAQEGPGPGTVLERLDALGAQVQAQEAEIARLRGELEQLQLAQRGRGTTGQQDPAQRVAAEAAQGAALEQQADPAQPAPGEPQVQIGQARADEDAERREQEKALVVREHAPLFERKFTFDAGLTYSYYDRRSLALSGFLALDAIFLGTINLDQTKATVGTLEMTGRYGLTDRLSVEATVPYTWRDSRFISAGAGGASTQVSEVRVSDEGIGDASIAAYYQWVKESQRWPDIVTSLRVRAPTGRDPFGLKLIQADPTNNNLNIPEHLPTGSGVWAVTANVSALRTYDPVILFANLGYTYNRPEDVEDISAVVNQVSPARVKLGDTIQISGGLAIALNDRSAISFSVSSAFSASTTTQAPGGQEGRVPGSASNTTTFNIGSSYVLRSGWSVNGQLAAGLTPDAPNFIIGLRASRSF